MNPNIDQKIQQKPQNVQGDLKGGLFKGIVVDVRDPSGAGRVRVHSYPLHGDYKDLNVNAIPWAEPLFSNHLQFSPPELYDRVWLSFENGDQYCPVYLGYWYACPMGRGTLPYSRRVGSEVRPEAWHSADLYPETLILAASAEGNVIWFENKLLDDDHLLSTINLEDTGSKFIKIWSLHPDTSDYAPDSAVTGSLDGANVQEGDVTRTGVDLDNDPVTGAIEIGHQNVWRSMQTGAETFTADQLFQLDNNADLSFGSLAISGQIWKTRQGNAGMVLADNAAFLNSPVGVFVPKFLTTPKRWDT